MNEIVLKIKDLLPFIKDFFELLGILIITAGSLFSMFKYVIDLFKKRSHFSFVKFRILLSRFIATGLELIIVADLINTTINVTYYSLGMLLMLVIIRTIIGYFLNKDLEVITAGPHYE